MSMVQINCPQCQESLQIPETYIGQRGRCARCGQEILVPDASHATSVPMTQTPSRKSKRNKRVVFSVAVLGLVLVALAFLTLVVYVFMEPFDGYPIGAPDALTQGSIGFFLEQNGYRIKSDQVFEALGCRMVTFRKPTAHVASEITITSLIESSDLHSLGATVVGPEENIDFIGEGLREISHILPRIIPGTDQALARACESWNERGTEANPDDGIPRMQGAATTESGWRLTMYYYLWSPPKPEVIFAQVSLERLE